jgi:hypothetical protein
MRILLIVLGYVRELLERLCAHPIWTNSEVENVWLGRCAMGFVMTASMDLALLEEAVTGKTASADVSICDHWGKTLLHIFRSTNCPRRKYASGLDSRIFPEGNHDLAKRYLGSQHYLFLPRQFTKYTRKCKSGCLTISNPPLGTLAKLKCMKLKQH